MKAETDELEIQDFVFDLNDGVLDTCSGHYISRRYGPMLEKFCQEYIDLRKEVDLLRQSSFDNIINGCF